MSEIDNIITGMIDARVAPLLVNIKADCALIAKSEAEIAAQEAIDEVLAAPPIVRKWEKVSPHHIDPKAEPQTVKPSAAIMTATAKAIEGLALRGVPQEFWGGPGADYWIDRTVAFSNVADQKDTARDITFHETVIRVAPDVPDANFVECTSQQRGILSLNGLDDLTDNLPPGVPHRVIIDRTNGDHSTINGKLIIDGGGKKLVGMAAANRDQFAGGNALCTTWQKVYFINMWKGMFGAPRYSGPRDCYATAFVGNTFEDVRFFNVDIPFDFGPNTCDDMTVKHMTIINKLGGRSYIYNAELKIDALYTSGESLNDYVIDIQRGDLDFRGFYAEGLMAAPIYARAGSTIKGGCKYGAGAGTKFFHKAFVYNDDVSGSGDLRSFNRSGDSADMLALVKLKTRLGSKRKYEVDQPYSEGLKTPFIVEAGNGIGNDQLFSISPEGRATWKASASPTGPVLTRSNA
jgi:hypothetical protein